MEKAIIVGVSNSADETFEYEMQELSDLTEACELLVCARMDQLLSTPNTNTYIGSGKLKELAEYVTNLEADYVVFSANLTPSQLKNIADVVPATIYDRTNLILEIFSKRAKTREARLQVESASLQYMLPRLVGMRASLGRQGGASGSMSNKGQGEKQIELDRRHIEKRISELSRELKKIAETRMTQRKKRTDGNIPTVSLVGYTNAGKSTLMNALVDISKGEDEKHVFEKDMLFATLDTSVRRITTGDNLDFLLSDTVGFISNLPHGLVKAFRSTLEEAKYADLILVVVDASDEHRLDQLSVTEKTLSEIEAGDIPRIYVNNKCDLLSNYQSALDIGMSNSTDKAAASKQLHEPIVANSDFINISAATGEGIETLLKEIKKRIYPDVVTAKLLIPFSDGSILGLLENKAKIHSREYLPEGIEIEATYPGSIASLVEKYKS